MHRRIAEILESRHGNYVLPFLWMHGEDESVLREEMARIHEAGIGAVCAESRPHPDFCGALWWRDMDILMDEARHREMKVWVLDDVRFPTGFANGWIRDKFPQLKKVYLAERHVDVAGPHPGATVSVQSWLADDESVISVVAIQRTATGETVDQPPLDLTHRVARGRLHWDVPEGYWRVFIIVQTPHGGGDPDYINPIDAASCRVQIDAVYEPHYERYASDFGKTFAGFFTDEPNIGNTEGWYDCAIGRKPMALPWRVGLLAELDDELGGAAATRLPGLWHDIGSATWPVRFAFMNLVSRLYGACFTKQIADWCVDRGVEYIGHIVEDNDAHTRLGRSVPHFFRALGAQTMSGIDVVLQQIRPGFDQQMFHWPAGDGDGEFFHYELAKLGASLAHIAPHMRGRAMCEVYGAYGWYEGVRLMKWLTDHMLVRGINWYVPHAFSPREFPDGDCPPHFYARGQNPQYRHFRTLMEYTNRVCHLLNDGRHVAEAAVLYHAEAEWSGACMSVKEPMRVLMQAQLDADIVPADSLIGNASVRDGKLVIGSEDYGCLILPWAERLPRAVLETVASMLDQGLKVTCLTAWPTGVSEGDDATVLLGRIRNHRNAQRADLEQLPEVLREWGLDRTRTKGPEPSLRRYEYRHAGLSVWMFFNEDPWRTICSSARLEGAERIAAYDPFTNRLAAMSGDQEDGGLRVGFVLAPDESIIILSGDLPEVPQRTHWSDADRIAPLATAEWQVSTADAQAYPNFTPWRTLESPVNLCQPELLPDFSGTLRYDTTCQCDARSAGRCYLDLGAVGEVAEVWLNDVALGKRICRPYMFDVTDALRSGENALRVEVTNTLVYAVTDVFSRLVPHDPSGLIGPVQLRWTEQSAVG